MDSIQGARMKLVRMQGNWTRTLGIAGFASVLAILAPSVATAADTDSGAIAYGEQVVGPQKHATGLTALGPDLFGEEINTFTGGIAFSQTDLSLPGNDALPVNVTRRLVVDGNKSPSFNADLNIWRGFPFGEWEIGLPYLGGSYSEQDGWGVSTTNPSARCSSPATYDQFAPHDVMTSNEVWFYSFQFWNGLQLNVPGEGEQEVVYRPADSSLPVPSETWTALTTKNQWHFACLPSLKSGQVGEGFLALAPDGTKYWLDWMVSYGNRPLHGFGTIDVVSSAGGRPGRTEAYLQRRDYRLYPTRIEDRFGNYVTYAYASTASQGLKLTQISASDGRSISFTYNLGGQIASATAGTQTVHYSYADGLLSSVTLPDGSSWGYSTAAVVDLKRFVLLSDENPFDDPFSCQRMRRLTGDQADLVMTHPSGAKGVFHLAYNRLYRTDLKNSLVDCGFFNNPDGTHPSWRDLQPNIPLRSDVLALQSKTLSGPGVAAQTWQYQHQDTYQLRSPDGDPINGTRTMTTVRPDGSKDVSVFGSDALINEGQLLSQEVRNAAGTALSRRVNTYVQTSEMATAPFADWMGKPLADEGVLGPEHYNRPLKQSVLQQQGVSFTWQVPAACFGTSTLCFDQLVRPVRTIKSSTLGYSKTEATTYADNTAKWVLGQVARTTCITSTPTNAGCDNGTDSVESETTFDPTYAMPLTTKVFNKVQKTLAYDLTSAVGTAQRGTLRTVKDGNNNVTTVTNWKRGIPQTITYPATPDQPTPVQESAVVDDNGWITAVTDENGYATGYGYDAMGRLTSIAYPAGDSTVWNATTIAYQKTGATTTEYGIPGGHWKRTESTGNARKVTYYDAMWRPLVDEQYDTANAAATRSVAVKRYDVQGRLAFQAYPVASLPNGYVDATLKGTDTLYDALDRVIEVDQDAETTLPLKTMTAYLSGFKTQVTNPRGYRTITGYMAFDEPTTDWPVDIDAADGTADEADTDITRDVFGKPLAITRHDPGNATRETRSYAYDAYQLLCKTIEPETASTLVDYDGANNVIWSASGQALPAANLCDRTSVPLAEQVTRSHDARNRVLSVVFPDHRGDTTSHYTPDGLIASVTADNGGTDQVTTSYAYNQRRLLTRETLAWAAINWPVSYAYDANGHLASQSWHGVSATYAPNALGQPTQVGSYATGVSYFPNGALKQFTYGNGIVHTLTQNARQLPDTSTDAYGLTKVISDSYDYDPNGNVQAITDGATGRNQRGNRDMTYDALDRLKSAASPMFGSDAVGTASYSYDALDNLAHVHMPATKTATTATPERDWYYCYDARWQLTNLKTGTCSGATVVGLDYDVRGNLKQKNGLSFDFDDGNRLRDVTDGVGTVTSNYVYDALGRRVRDTTTANKFSQYTQSGQLAMTTDARTNKVDDYFYLAGSLVAIRERDVPTGVYTVKYQHTDALGSPVAVTDASRTVVERSEYEPYGKVLTNAPHDGPGYTGHVLDVATGLNYMQQRYYDPQVGRFLSVDPVSANENTGGNFNRYWYANNNPYKFTDPDGRCADGVTCEAMGQSFANNPDAAKPLAPVAVVGIALMAAPVAVEAGIATLANPGAVATATNVAAEAAGVTGTGGALAAETRGVGTASVAGVEGVATPSGMRAALTEAGYPGRAITNEAATESGTLHNVPGMKMDARIMDGGPHHGPRISVTRQGTPQPVNPANGKNLGNISRAEQNAQSHIPLRKDDP